MARAGNTKAFRRTLTYTRWTDRCDRGARDYMESPCRTRLPNTPRHTPESRPPLLFILILISLLVTRPVTTWTSKPQTRHPVSSRPNSPASSPVWQQRALRPWQTVGSALVSCSHPLANSHIALERACLTIASAPSVDDVNPYSDSYNPSAPELVHCSSCSPTYLP